MKKIALLISIPFIAVIVAFFVLVLLVNPNDFKPLIKEQVEAQTGRQLTIDGDIDWRFFPTIGFSIGEVALSNPDGFATPDLVKFNNAVLDLNVRPLLQHEINIGLVTLDGASFTLHTLKNGVSNLDNIGPEKVKDATAEVIPTETVSAENTKPSAQLNDWKLTLDGIALTNAKVLIQDDKAGTKMYFSDMNLSLSQFSPGEWATLSFNLKGDLGQQKVALDGKTELNIAATLDAASLKQTEFTASYSDASNKFKDITFSIDQFSFDEWANIRLKAAGKANALQVSSNSTFALYVPKALDVVQVKDFSSTNNVKGKGIPNEDVTAVIGFNSSFDLNKSYLKIEKLALSAVDTDFNGKMSVQLNDIPKVRFELQSPNVDVDALLATLPQSEATATEKTTNSNKKVSASKAKEVEPDLSALKTLDVAGSVVIDKFKANNAKMQNVTSVFSVNRGVLKLTKFHSDLYDGAIDMTATLDARKTTPTYSIKQSIKGVQVAPLLTDVMGESLIEGNGNMALNVSGKSLKPSALKENLKGKASINFADGAVNGINIPLLIRTTYAKIKGEKVKGSEEAEKTDFSALTADFYLSKGNATTKNIKMISPLLRIHGNGSADYVHETANMLIKTSIVGTLKGQGGKDIDDLKDITIPIRITGPWAKPKYKLEFDDVLQQKAKKEIDRGIEKLEEKYGDKIKDEKVKEAANKLLKGLFN
ncbi:AsmA family protein [Aliivibrio sp. S3MY1]|uniref:AsmA family protein n=1 Tax=unclassified Aliivibrio TaxID=2645654 RepID=UPI0023789994|nr:MULTISPECIES: AsmA family protein [unclassified Aliivibrio]MDD9195476.1 AsmA family protein [Aliivibrio sp. S3MY1]MDD9198771.1 AsmA family protein [Aliivibrio sp. S2MY1]